MKIKATLVALVVRHGNIVKYRLVSISKEGKAEVYDATESQLLTVIKNGSMEVDNLQVHNNTIKGKGAQLSRYTKVTEFGEVVSSKSPLVILSKLIKDGDTIGYTVSDHKGTVVNGKTEDVIQYAIHNGIANGKIVEKGGKYYISSILDTFDENNIESSTQRSQVTQANQAIQSVQAEVKNTTNIKSILSSDPIHHKLLKDKYIDKSEQLYKLYQSCKSTEIPSLELDRCKFKHIELGVIIDNQHLKLLELPNSESMKNKVYSICNFITKHTHDYTSVITKEFIQELFKIANVNRVFRGVKYRELSLITLHIELCGETFLMLNIIENNHLEFCTFYSLDKNKIRESVFDYKYYTNSEGWQLVKNLKLGVQYPFRPEEARDKLEAPNYIVDKFTSTLKLQFILLGACEGKNINNKLYIDEAYLLNTLSGKIYKSALIADCSSVRELHINDIQSIRIISCGSVDNLDNNAASLIISSCFNQDTTDNLIYTIKNLEKSNEVIQDSKKEDSEPCIEWKAGKKLKMQKPKALSEIKITTYRDIFKTTWFIGGSKNTASLKDIKQERIQLNDSKYTIIMYKLSKDDVSKATFDALSKLPGFKETCKYMYFTTIVSNDNLKKSPMTHGYFSVIDIKSVVKSLTSIYSKVSTDEPGIHRESVNISNYSIIIESNRNILSNSDKKEYIAIGIGKRTGVAKALAVYKANSTYEVYELFEISNIKKALKLGILDDNNTKYTSIGIITKIRELNLSSDNIKITKLLSPSINTIVSAREAALSGLSKETLLHLPGDLGAIFSLSETDESKNSN